MANKTPDRVLADLRLHHIGFVFQTFNLLPSLTALENVEVSLVVLVGKAGSFFLAVADGSLCEVEQRRQENSRD